MNNSPELENISSVFIDCLNHLNLKSGDKFGYMEFGCHIGHNLIAAKDVFEYMDVSYVAFDSFSGLPAGAEEESKRTFTTGQYNCDQNELYDNLTNSKFPMNSIAIHLEEFSNPVDGNFGYDSNFKIFLFNCKLYSTTKNALKFFVDYASDECIIIFTDWYSGHLNVTGEGQKKAFLEFKNAQDKFEIQDLNYYSVNGNLSGRYFYLKTV